MYYENSDPIVTVTGAEMNALLFTKKILKYLVYYLR